MDAAMFDPLFLRGRLLLHLYGVALSEMTFVRKMASDDPYRGGEIGFINKNLWPVADRVIARVQRFMIFLMMHMLQSIRR